MSNILYLHGFASGPQSTKGTFFARQFSQIGATVHQPDLSEGDFRGLTLTKQLKLIDRLARELRPTLLMGSSLGGYLAALYGANYPELAPKLVLLAPAFGFPRRWSERLGEERMAEWRQTGEMEVYHYGASAMQPIGYPFYEDSLWFDPYPPVEQPTLLFHGKYDEDVPLKSSLEFSLGKPNVRLEMLESDHRLTDVLDPIWNGASKFYQDDHLAHL
jgi:pimeloyl-ACP methyl ester carboxylesterase